MPKTPISKQITETIQTHHKREALGFLVRNIQEAKLSQSSYAKCRQAGLPKGSPCPDNYMFGLHCRNAGLWQSLFLEKKRKINQSELWLDRSAVKPSHVENRAAAALQDQKNRVSKLHHRAQLSHWKKKEKKKNKHIPPLPSNV